MNLHQPALVFFLSLVGCISAQCTCPGAFIPYDTHTAFFTTTEIDLSSVGGIQFYNEHYDSIHVNQHAILSFDAAHDENENDCDGFPISDASRSDWAAIFLYWFDGTICPGTLKFTDPPLTSVTHTDTINILNGQVNNCKGDDAFTATYAIVVTWDKFGIENCQNVEHTFQAVVLSDGIKTYVIRDYQLLTNSEDSGGQFAAVGYNGGDGMRGYSDPLSCTSEVNSLVSASNVDCPGIFIDRVDVPIQCDIPPLNTDVMTCTDYTRFAGDTISCTCNDGAMVVTGTDDLGGRILDGTQITLTCNIETSTFEGAITIEDFGIGCVSDCRGCYVCPESETLEECEANQTYEPCTTVDDDCGSQSSSGSSNSSGRKKRSKEKKKKRRKKKRKHRRMKHSHSRSSSDNTIPSEPMCVTSYRKHSGERRVRKYCSNGCIPNSYQVMGPGECPNEEVPSYYGGSRQKCAEVSQPICEAQ